MSDSSFPSPEAPGAGAQFTTTHWSVVLEAGAPDSPRARQALETLCEAYWLPLYAYVRRAGHGPEEAQDLTQEFFATLLQKHTVEKADPSRGRFRTFLLTALKHFLINEWAKTGRQKRGGGRAILSLDHQAAEAGYLGEPVDHLSPDKIYEHRWATTLLERVLQALQREYVAGDKGRLFDGLKDYVWGEKGGAPYARIAEGLQMTEGAVKVSVHRLRQRFRELLRLEIAQTVSDPAAVDEELRHLIAVVVKS